MSYILALDQGTTSSRAIVFDKESQIISVAQKEFTQIFPHSGWVEHNLHEIWETQRDTAITALQNANLTAEDVSAIGITNQRETTVIWNRKTGEPVCNAIVWQDLSPPLRRLVRGAQSHEAAGGDEADPRPLSLPEKPLNDGQDPLHPATVLPTARMEPIVRDERAIRGRPQ